MSGAPAERNVSGDEYSGPVTFRPYRGCDILLELRPINIKSLRDDWSDWRKPCQKNKKLTVCFAELMKRE